MVGRGFADWLSSLLERAAMRLRQFSSRLTVTRASYRTLTKDDWGHFDAAIAKMDEAFDELRKIK